METNEISRAFMYEYIIQKAFNIDPKDSFLGATAGIYNALMEKQGEENFEYGVKIGEVSAYLRMALFEIKRSYPNDEKIQSTIERCIDRLSQEDSINSIDECITNTYRVFQEKN